MDYININRIGWNKNVYQLLKKVNINKNELFEPNKTTIKKIKNNDFELYQNIKSISNNEYLNINTNNSFEILSDEKILLAYILLGFQFVPVIIETINNDFLNKTSESDDYEGSEEFCNNNHFDSEGCPDESNDVWEYGDCYHLND